MTETTRLITPKFRASYVFLFEPQQNKNEDGSIKKEYTVTAIFPKGTDLTPLKQAATNAIIAEFGTDQSKWPANLRSPFRKCKERWTNEGGKQVIPGGYEDGDATFMTFKAGEKYRPGVVDAQVQDIIEPRVLYSGCYARASVEAFFYGKDPKKTRGNRGVSFGLRNIQKLEDGEPLGRSNAKPTDDFEPVADANGGAAPQSAASVFD